MLAANGGEIRTLQIGTTTFVNNEIDLLKTQVVEQLRYRQVLFLGLSHNQFSFAWGCKYRQCP